MSRRKLLFLNLFLLVAMLVSPALVNAAPPAPPLNSLNGLPAPDVNNLKPSAELKAAEAAAQALKQELSADQVKAMSAVLAKYDGEMKAIAKDLPAMDVAPLQGKPDTATARARMARDAKSARVLQNAATALAAVQAKIDAELATVLNSAQLGKYQAGLAPAKADLATAQAKLATGTNGAVQPATSYTASYCWNSGYYAAVADLYQYYARTYAYYNYYYNYYGTYNGYYYLYYAGNNSNYGLADISLGYFDIYTWDSDRHNGRYYAVSYLYYAYYYGYYGYYYEASNYSSYGYTYAYYAYYYAYYAYQYDYNAYIYAYYC